MEKKTKVRKLIILISCLVVVLVVIVFIVMHYSYQSQIGSTKQNPSHIKTIAQGGYQSLISRLEHDLPRIMDEDKIPGLSIALINNSGIIWHGNFGVKSIKTNSPIDDSTVFMAASFSKVVFAYYVLKMVDEGKLNLDTPLIDYAPKSYIEKEFLKIKDDRFNRITPRMVLSHSTGFPDRSLFKRSVKINFIPGDRFRYSGEGFLLLQKIVEYIEGESINEIIKKNVFMSLGMNNSSYVYEKRFKTILAKGHNAKGKQSYLNWLLLKRKKAHAARSLLTTSEDYAKFLMALMNGKGLNKETFNKMLSPQINAGSLNSDHIYWGLGLGIESRKIGNNKDIIYWHNGDAMIFRNYFAFTKQKIGLVYFTNSANGLAIGQEITGRVIDGYHPSFRWLGFEQYGFN